MTEKRKRLSAESRLSRGQMLFCIVSVAAMCLTFAYSEVAIEAMSAGMKLCVETVIPSLFPFMVLSELLISSGAAELLGRTLARPFSALFGLSREGAVALLLGFLCGFPIGAKSALSLYERGRISRGELEHLMSFCNNPSSAFLISAVGGGFFGSRGFGVMLYATHILSSCAIGFFGRAYFSKEKKKEEYCLSPTRSKAQGEGIAAAVTRSVTDSAGSMLFICAFVIFFSAVIGFLRLFADSVGLPDGLSALIFGFFEMTGGASSASSLPLRTAIPAVAAITGWSGLSVHFQLMGICREHKISLTPYFFSKLVCAALNTVIVSLLSAALWDRLSFGADQSISSLLTVAYQPLSVISLALFAGGCAMLRRKAGGKG